MKDQEITAIAAICHNANKDYCESIGDASQKRWAFAEDWQKESAKEGVNFHIANPDAGAVGSHENWLRHKLADGWKWGEVKDPDAKTHPCMVPFAALPLEQQAKDRLFCAIVRALTE